MPGAVFGDFLAAAREHLEAAVAVREDAVTWPPAIAQELSRLVAVMSRYCDDLAPCDQVRGIRPRRSASVGARSNRCRRGPAHRGGLPASRRSRARRRPGERDGAAASAAPGSRRDRARGGQGPAAHPSRHRSGRADAGEVGMGVRSDFGTRYARSGKRGRAMVTAARALHGMACRLRGSVCPPGRAWSDSSQSLCALNSQPQASGSRLPVPLCTRRFTSTRCGQRMPSCCARSRQPWCRSDSGPALPGSRSPSCATGSPSAPPGCAARCETARTGLGGHPASPREDGSGWHRRRR